MIKQTVGYKVIWKPVEFRPEWLEAHAKRQAKSYRRINELDDALEASQSHSNLLPGSIPLIMAGSILGAIVGAIIGWLFVGWLLH